ncbi:hypothetical protein B0A55_00384 [Friedmanniomyces simplex]|uniref:Uncharacterized protein n=1 Tax=Friedmanniomyces simplex TaxID=329884 RepID=A0A4U0Y5T0_9PEZI|nr:hypothetical protein B0A55_00384 [Friedmanniomyces simplex]
MKLSFSATTLVALLTGIAAAAPIANPHAERDTVMESRNPEPALLARVIEPDPDLFDSHYSNRYYNNNGYNNCKRAEDGTETCVKKARSIVPDPDLFDSHYSNRYYNPNGYTNCKRAEDGMETCV